MTFASFPPSALKNTLWLLGVRKAHQLLGKANGYEFDADNTSYGYVGTDSGGLSLLLSESYN